MILWSFFSNEKGCCLFFCSEYFYFLFYVQSKLFCSRIFGLKKAQIVLLFTQPREAGQRAVNNRSIIGKSYCSPSIGTYVVAGFCRKIIKNISINLRLGHVRALISVLAEPTAADQIIQTVPSTWQVRNSIGRLRDSLKLLSPIFILCINRVLNFVNQAFNKLFRVTSDNVTASEDTSKYNAVCQSRGLIFIALSALLATYKLIL